MREQGQPLRLTPIITTISLLIVCRKTDNSNGSRKWINARFQPMTADIIAALAVISQMKNSLCSLTITIRTIRKQVNSHLEKKDFIQLLTERKQTVLPKWKLIWRMVNTLAIVILPVRIHLFPYSSYCY